MQFQGRLGDTLHKLFPDKEIFTNAKKSGNIVSTSSQRYLELDFWLPSLKLAVEYQDPHHYVTTWYAFSPRDGVQQRDNEKLKLIEERGDTLVLVPCWWDGSEDKLVATIRKKRPELLVNHSVSCDPIDAEPPPGYFKVDCVPSVGELMIATFGYSTSHTRSWWIAEKYDGLRACWNPLDRTLYSRAGRRLAVSVLQRAKFPLIFLDGEIWFGRGSYKELHGILKRKREDGATFHYTEKENENAELHAPENENEELRATESGDEEFPGTEDEIWEFEKGEKRKIWESLRFVIFDSPAPDEKELEFEKRFAKIVTDSSLYAHPLLLQAPVHANTNARHLQEQTKQILEDGGEGIVIRRPNSLYAHGRSKDLLKFKAERDQEAMVVSVEGDYIALQLPSMHTVTAKSIDVTDYTPPKIGDIVTYAFSYLSSQEAIPQDVKILRIRKDMTWHDVIRNEALSLPRKRSLNFITASAYSAKFRNRMGYWTENGGANIRRFFDEFSRKRNLDPLDPATWRAVTSREILHEGGAFLYHYKCSVFQALSDAYPEVPFDPLKFVSVSRHYWSDTNNIRKFFDNFAKKRGFDPLSARAWYSYKQEDIVMEKNGGSVLHHFSHSYPKALSTIYPEVNFDSKLFGRTYGWSQPASKKRSVTSYWFSLANRKQVFDKFAEKRNFDPTLPVNWDGMTKEDILAELGGIYALKHYGGSLKRAVADIYGFGN
eukprot:Phypoly_transcript_03703.p1 GENE.Phypoly_transcript_03703~~Phypoly_transcript_03703.p1  ORF type:complete len:716 (-),score=110.69 Phypoly_transcript_03703:87-2234(-)